MHPIPRAAVTSSTRRVRRLVLAVAAAMLAATAAAPAAGAQARPLGIDCVPRDDVRFCQGSTATRVRTFDGVPLDVNVTLPAQGDSGLPLVVLLHGWGGSKVGFDESRRWAAQGYAALSYSARGFGESCGSESSRLADPAGCAKGWVHLADVRYEARDTQHLSGLLADEGVIDPQRVGVTGPSYGGGQSLALATLRDRVMLQDGALVPWESPGGKPMRIAAAAPLVPWSDLVYSLLPNGRTLDYALTGPREDLDPLGIKKESYVDGLYASGESNGYYAPPGADPDADLRTWFARLSAGEPYDGDPVVQDAVEEIADHHSPYYLYLQHGVRPSPLLISNGFTDDLFPVDEALRYVNRVTADHADATIAQLHFDYGHPRGQSKPEDIERLRQAVHAFFDRHVKGDALAQPPTGVTALTQTCPKSAPSGGPFTATTWDALSPGEVRFGTDGSQRLTSAGGDPEIAAAIDPVAGGGSPCRSTQARAEPGTADYRFKPTRSGYTLLGSPTVVAGLDVTGVHTQVAARLWDVAPDGTQTLVARSLYRPSGDGRVVFQLHPNGWRFEAGHAPRLQLLGRDAPYARPSNSAFAIDVADLELRLPVREAPRSSSEIKEPRPNPTP